MKICDTVYQLKVEFNVTPQVKRYVYVYIITGKKGCYLVDAGVKGCDKKIEEYIHKIGKNLNKPVTFVKKNTRNVLIGVSGVASLIALFKNNKK